MKILHLILLLALFINKPAFTDEGMWIPLLLRELNEAEMKSMGMQIQAEDIFSSTSGSLKDAVVIFGGGCTGAIISEQGLVITNHHCSYGRIQALSSLENDYLTNGFWASDSSEELPVPGLKVTFLTKMEEVTERVLEGVADTMPETERARMISQNIKVIEKETTENSHYQVVIKPFFYGNRFFLSVNEVFEDVRLVGAPPSSIGKFGGDTDNWMWPRHTGDFALFRIYADSNNLPATFSTHNVAYAPQKHLTISLDGANEGDFTFVFGYPGSTEQYIPSTAIDMYANILNPVRIDVRTKRLDIFRKYMHQSPEIRLQYTAKESGIANGWKKWIGENRGIRRLSAIEQKQEFESAFVNWVEEDPDLKERYSTLLPELEKTYTKLASISYFAEFLREVAFGIEVFRFSRSYRSLVDLSKNKESSQESINQAKERLLISLPSFFRNYQQVIDREVYISIVEDYYKKVQKDELPEELIKLEQKFKADFTKMADYLFTKSIFTSQEKAEAFLEGYKQSHYKKIEKDPVYQLADGFFNHYFSFYIPEIRALNTKRDSLMRFYIRAQMLKQPMKRFYPDANFTLRVSYGNVAGYNPDDAVFYRYFTTLTGIIEKEDPDIFDYRVDEKLKSLYAKKDFGDYADVNGNLRTCFIATNHTTGGNSGSPVLNGDGHLIGLNFDRCWEGTMSDLIFDMSQCRNISLDIRYCLFIIDKFAGARHLIDEMTIVRN